MGDKNWKEMFGSSWGREGTLFIQFLLHTGLDVNALNKFGKTMLSYAAECGNLQIVEFLVQEGADANVANSNGSKPLHIAAQYRRKDIVKFFLNRGISVDSFDNDKCTPLHCVAVADDISYTGRESYQELVHILVDHKADIDAVDRKGCTPLLLASQASKRHMVELFIKLGANLECSDQDQFTVLHHACKNGWSGAVRTLLEGRFEFDLNARTSKGCTPVIIAAKHSHEDIVKLLVESGAEIESNWSRTLLHLACRNGWLEVVKRLVSKRCDLNAKDESRIAPLITAADYSHSSVVEYLIECGADVKCCDKNEQTLLHLACKKGWLEVVKSLVNKGYDLNKDKWEITPLKRASLESHLSVVEYMIECGADVKCCNQNGHSLVHCAAANGWLNVVKSLVNKEFDLNVRDSFEMTPLMVAAEHLHFSVFEYLMECGPDTKCCDDNGWTALHHASKMGGLEYVKSLVNKGCDLNVKAQMGMTPLMLAAFWSRLSVVEYLIDCGSDTKCWDQHGWTVLHRLCRVGELEVKCWKL